MLSRFDFSRCFKKLATGETAFSADEYEKVVDFLHGVRTQSPHTPIPEIGRLLYIYTICPQLATSSVVPHDIFNKLMKAQRMQRNLRN